MAKKSIIVRNEKRKLLVKKYADKRGKLKKILKDPNISRNEYLNAQRKLALLPRNTTPTRIRNRCSITGRGRAYIGKYGISRIVFRELARKGELPGVTTSSW